MQASYPNPAPNPAPNPRSSPAPDSPPDPGLAPTRRRSAASPWLLLLLLPYAALCFPALYARSTPALFGFPFFYWYQFAWVLIASALMALVYRKTRD